MRTILLLTFLLCICKICFSQNIYRTLSGHVLISGEINDSAFIAESHKLEFHYDSKTRNIYGKIKLGSINSGIFYLDNILSKNAESIVSFEGFVPVDFLTWEHKEYNLNVPLELKFNNKTTKISSQIKFTHASNLTIYTCIMEAAFPLDLVDLKVDVPANLSSKINVQFLQLILRRGNQ
ncbi:MAG: hypothetical protein IPJ53_13275 [Saprospiraceae bacterium]|nr:hypothetical protein [Candidatus Vicinibacter affinis]